VITVDLISRLQNGKLCKLRVAMLKTYAQIIYEIEIVCVMHAYLCVRACARHNPEDVSGVRVPVKMTSLVRKLCTLEEQRQDQICLFRREYYRKKRHSPEALSWV
jgi:hypothetical protein